MAVKPVCTALSDREIIGEGLARLDPVEGDAGDTILLKRQDKAVPVDRSILGQVVRHLDRNILTFLEAQNGRHGAPVIADTGFREFASVDRYPIDRDIIFVGHGRARKRKRETDAEQARPARCGA